MRNMLRDSLFVSLCVFALAACGTGDVQSAGSKDASVDGNTGGFVGTPVGAGGATSAGTGTATSAGNGTAADTGTTGGSTMTGTTTGGSTSPGGTTTTGTTGTTTGASTGTTTGAPTGTTTGAAPGPNGSGTCSGSVAGISLTPQSATWVVVRKQLIVTLWEQPNACALVSLGVQPRGARLSLTLLNFGVAGTLDPVPGVYTVEPQSFKMPAAGLFAAAAFDSLDSKCKSTLKGNAGNPSGGTVTLSTVGTTYGGNFALGFKGTDALTGSFNAVACPAAALDLKLTCQP